MRSIIEVARGVQEILQRYKELQDIIAILGMDELVRRRQAGRIPCPKDPEIPVPAILRGRTVHRSGRKICTDFSETIRGFT